MPTNTEIDDVLKRLFEDAPAIPAETFWDAFVDTQASRGERIMVYAALTAAALYLAYEYLLPALVWIVEGVASWTIS